MNKTGLGCLMAILGIFLTANNGLGYEINDKLSIGGIIAGIGQYQSINDAPEEFENEGRGLVLFEPEISFTPPKTTNSLPSSGLGRETVWTGKAGPPL